MHIRSKFLIIGGLMVSIAVANAFFTHNTVATMDKQAVALYNLNSLRVMQMELDMMHDAIRSDTVDLKNLVSNPNPPARYEALSVMKEHHKRGLGIISDISNLHLSDAFDKQTAQVKSDFELYTRLSQAVADAPDGQQAEQRYQAFDKQFKKLEDVLEKYVEECTEIPIRNLREEQQGTVHTARMFMLSLTMINLLLALCVPLFVMRGILHPQKTIITAMRDIAEGRLDTAVPHLERRDEIGKMALSLQVFRDNALEKIHLEKEQDEKDKRAEEQKRKTMSDLAGHFEANVKAVVDMVASAATEMDATSRSVGATVNANKGKLENLATQIENTSRSVQSVASATSQLSSAVNEINQQISRATSITSTAVNEAQQADVTVQSLTEAAGKIGEVVEMINAIAAQINLLALNATIEAARAGDAGKGFAVVASEVKNLATQTTKATEQIAQLISAIQGATGQTVSAIGNIGTKIREINEISTTIAAAVEEQSVATREIAGNVQQAAESSDQVLSHAGEVSRASSETGESATQMVAATTELSNQSELLRNEVDKFLAVVRG